MSRRALLALALALLTAAPAASALLPPAMLPATAAATSDEVPLGGGFARAIGVEVVSEDTDTLVEARASAFQGAGSTDRASAVHLRAATHTLDTVTSDASATPTRSAATARAARLSLLDGDIVLEGITAEARSEGGRGSGGVNISRLTANGVTYTDAFLVNFVIPVPGGRLIVGERQALPNGFRASAVHLIMDNGDETLVLSATATAGFGPRLAALPPMPSRAQAAATTLEVTGGYRAGDDIAARADGYADGEARGLLSHARASSTGTASSARAQVQLPTISLLGGLVEARNLLTIAEAGSDDTLATTSGFARVGELVIDGTFVISPVPPEWSLELPGIGMLHANEVRLSEVEDPDTSTTLARVEAIALRLVLLDGGEGVGRETSVGRVTAESFAPRTPRVELRLAEFGNPIRAGDVVTTQYTLRSGGTATLTEGTLVDDHLGVVCTYRLLRPGETLPCTRLHVVTEDLDHTGTTDAVDAWGAMTFAAARGFIEVIDA